ncbi:hypothetical protein DPMN_155657 [Dreissena polymorpha]|uniref:Uncharacterized protein n=1 Tax=Dreissena polymorpha TaxID=45954 RepID=A0A9D4FPT6_DREPO|nr:hypothetical protein DPMN_155657 [Dreissena polymorpha]
MQIADVDTAELNMTMLSQIAELPHISWEKYTSTLDFSTFGSHRHMTRLKKQLTDGNVPPGVCWETCIITDQFVHDHVIFESCSVKRGFNSQANMGRHFPPKVSFC